MVSIIDTTYILLLKVNKMLNNQSDYSLLNARLHMFSEEGFAQMVDHLTTCIDQKFTIRINNGADRCTQTTSDLVVELINRVVGVEHPCPGTVMYIY